MNNALFMVFDVESVGLHGEGFSVGYVVIDAGQEVDSGYYRCHPKHAAGLKDDCDWVMANVVPVMDADVSCRFWDGIGSYSPRQVRDAFWERWMSWKGNGAVLAADVPWPVEARFLSDCIRDDPRRRRALGPYPLIDVASVRLAAGLDPLATLPREEGENPPHHPLADARQSARLLLDAILLAG